jgi:hypothetical protein
MAIISSLPEGATVLDLAAERAARQEARAAQGLGDPFIKLEAGYVQVHPEVPLAAAFLLQDGKIKEGLAMLLVDEADIEALWPILTSADFEAISNFITGKTVGESLA